MTDIPTRTDPVAALAAAGIDVGPPIPPLGSYRAVAIDGTTAYTAGVVGLRAPEWSVIVTGTLGVDLSAEDAYVAARTAMISTLANLAGELGDLGRIRRFLRLTGYVQAVPGAVGMPAALNGATDLLAQLWGESLVPARTAVGVAALPGGAAIEIECVLALHDAPRDPAETGR